MQLGCAGNWDNPRLPRKQPCKRDLRRCRFLLLRKSANQIHYRLVRFPVLWRKARDDVAEIILVELRIFADLSGKEAFTKRTEGNEPDSEFLQCRDHLRFRISEPQRVFALECSHRLNRMCSTDRLH